MLFLTFFLIYLLPYVCLSVTLGKIFARSLPLLRAKLVPYLTVPGVGVRTARTGAIQDLKNNSLPGLGGASTGGSGTYEEFIVNLLSFHFLYLFYVFCQYSFYCTICNYFHVYLSVSSFLLISFLYSFTLLRFYLTISLSVCLSVCLFSRLPTCIHSFLPSLASILSYFLTSFFP